MYFSSCFVLHATCVCVLCALCEVVSRVYEFSFVYWFLCSLFFVRKLQLEVRALRFIIASEYQPRSQQAIDNDNAATAATAAALACAEEGRGGCPPEAETTAASPPSGEVEMGRYPAATTSAGSSSSAREESKQTGSSGGSGGGGAGAGEGAARGGSGGGVEEEGKQQWDLYEAMDSYQEQDARLVDGVTAVL